MFERVTEDHSKKHRLPNTHIKFFTLRNGAMIGFFSLNSLLQVGGLNREILWL